MAGALSAPGPGRLAAADAVVRADPTVTIGRGDDAEPSTWSRRRGSPPRPSSRPPQVPGVARAVGDVAFPAGAFDGRGRALHGAGVDRVQGHGWPSAALTPYRLTAGRAPAGPHDVVVDARLGARVGASLRIVTPGGEATYRVSGLASGRRAATGAGRGVLHRRRRGGAVGRARPRERGRRRGRAGRLRRRRCVRGWSSGRRRRLRARRGPRPRPRGERRRRRPERVRSRDPRLDLRDDGRDRGRRRAVRRGGHVRARDRPAPP